MIELTKNKNKPDQINKTKFNGGKWVDQPIIADIDVGAVAPWIRIIPTQPHKFENFWIILNLLIVNLILYIWGLTP